MELELLTPYERILAAEYHLDAAVDRERMAVRDVLHASRKLAEAVQEREVTEDRLEIAQGVLTTPDLRELFAAAKATGRAAEIAAFEAAVESTQ